MTVVLGVQLLVGISLSSAAVKFFYSGTILPGIKVENIDLGGLHYQEAVSKLQQELPWPAPESHFTLVGSDGQFSTIRFKDIAYSADYQASVEEALRLSREHTSWGNLGAMHGTLINGKNIPLAKQFNEDQLRAILKEQAKHYDTAARNAQLAINGDSVTLFEEIKGRRLDVAATLDQFHKVPLNTYRVDLQFQEVQPDISASDYGVNARLAFYMTEFDPKNQNRSFNIQLASKLINNRLVKPKEVFSLNKALGPRNQQNGYLPAPVIINDKLVPDYGGGVCQVATTLYNAVLLAGLTVVERSPHTLPVSYVPVGKDATIAGDIIDFKFLNSTPYPVILSSQVQGSKLFVSILGHKEGATTRVIKIDTERAIVKATRNYVEEKSLSPGQMVIRKPGKDGYKLKTYEIVLENGQEVKRRLVSQNEVKAEPEIVAISPRVKNPGNVNK